MARTILFEGKVTLADKLVDFRIYKNEDGEMTCYSYDINPELRDASQMGYHNGDSKIAQNLEDLLYQFKHVFQREFKQIVETRENKNY